MYLDPHGHGLAAQVTGAETKSGDHEKMTNGMLEVG